MSTRCQQCGVDLPDSAFGVETLEGDGPSVCQVCSMPRPLLSVPVHDPTWDDPEPIKMRAHALDEERKALQKRIMEIVTECGGECDSEAAWYIAANLAGRIPPNTSNPSPRQDVLLSLTVVLRAKFGSPKSMSKHISMQDVAGEVIRFLQEPAPPCGHARAFFFQNDAGETGCMACDMWEDAYAK